MQPDQISLGVEPLPRPTRRLGLVPALPKIREWVVKVPALVRGLTIMWRLDVGLHDCSHVSVNLILVLLFGVPLKQGQVLFQIHKGHVFIGVRRCWGNDCSRDGVVDKCRLDAGISKALLWIYPSVSAR